MRVLIRMPETREIADNRNLNSTSWTSGLNDHKLKLLLGRVTFLTQAKSIGCHNSHRPSGGGHFPHWRALLQLKWPHPLDTDVFDSGLSRWKSREGDVVVVASFELDPTRRRFKFCLRTGSIGLVSSTTLAPHWSSTSDTCGSGKIKSRSLNKFVPR